MINQTLTYLNVQASDFPANKYFSISGTMYLFKFKKNDSGIYTVEIWDQKGQNFLFSNKIIYGMPFVDSINGPFQNKIIPLNIDELNGESLLVDINDSTLGNQIKLYTGIIEA